MKTRAHLFLLTLLLGFAGALHADCSGGLCTDCSENQIRHTASCITVAENASCECSISVATPEFCILGGSCTYESSGAGGGGVGGGPGAGNGGSCARVPGEWCPSECSSCPTIYWN